MNKLIIILGVIIGAVATPSYSQQAVVAAQALTSGQYRALIGVPVLTGDVTLTLPSQTGALLATSNAWLLGGQALSSTGVIGTTDANDVTLVTNGSARLTVEGTAGTTQGFVGLQTATPLTQLHINGGMSFVPKVWDVTASGAAVTVGNSNFIVLTNSPAAPTDITLTDGLEEGQVVIVMYLSAANSVRVLNAGNIASGGAFTLAQSDVATYIWYDSRWRNLVHSNNVP